MYIQSKTKKLMNYIYPKAGGQQQRKDMDLTLKIGQEMAIIMEK